MRIQFGHAVQGQQLALRGQPVQQVERLADAVFAFAARGDDDDSVRERGAHRGLATGLEHTQVDQHHVVLLACGLQQAAHFFQGEPGAEGGARLSLDLLREAGYDAEMVAAPCCGMAGAFGFEREHYDASRAAFLRALGPALEAHPEAQVVVMGISCRKQIEHFTGRRVRHLAEVLRAAAGTVSEYAASPTSR